MKKDLNYYLNLKYEIYLEKNSDGTYFGEVKELIGCITEADSKEEVLQMLEDAKRAWLEIALERKVQIPEPM